MCLKWIIKKKNPYWQCIHTVCMYWQAGRSPAEWVRKWSVLKGYQRLGIAQAAKWHSNLHRHSWNSPTRAVQWFMVHKSSDDFVRRGMYGAWSQETKKRIWEWGRSGKKTNVLSNRWGKLKTGERVMKEVKWWEESVGRIQADRIQFWRWRKKEMAKEWEKVTNLFYQGDSKAKTYLWTQSSNNFSVIQLVCVPWLCENFWVIFWAKDAKLLSHIQKLRHRSGLSFLSVLKEKSAQRRQMLALTLTAVCRLELMHGDFESKVSTTDHI